MRQPAVEDEDECKIRYSLDKPDTKRPFSSLGIKLGGVDQVLKRGRTMQDMMGGLPPLFDELPPGSQQEATGSQMMDVAESERDATGSQKDSAESQREATGSQMIVGASVRLTPYRSLLAKIGVF
jgi:hypothetical protein